MNPAYPYAPGYSSGGIQVFPWPVELGGNVLHTIGTPVTFTVWVSRGRLPAGVVGATNPVYVAVSDGRKQWQSPNYTVPPLPAGSDNGPGVGIVTEPWPLEYDTFFTVQVFEAVTNKPVSTPAPDSGGYTFNVR